MTQPLNQAPTTDANQTAPRRPVAALAMAPELPARLFDRAQLQRLADLVDLREPVLDLNTPGLQSPGANPLTPEQQQNLAQVEVLVACWGAPRLDAELLAQMPELRAMIYAAGSIREVMTRQAYQRGITISSGADINALPVAEYVLGCILLAGKRVFALDQEYRQTGQLRPPSALRPGWGNYGNTVGIISASRIGRRVIELLGPFDIEVLLWDPTDIEPIEGVRQVGLDELLTSSDIVSIHAPSLPQTRGLIGRRELSLMGDGTTLINTSRGALLDQDALLAELEQQRIHAIIDVTEPDPLPSGHPLFSAPNLVLTPHIAGTDGNELGRMGAAAIDEVERFTRGEPFVRGIEQSAFDRMA